MSIRDFIREVPKKTIAFVSSPGFAAMLGVGVAVFQLAAAVEQLKASSKGKKQIGFGPNNPISKFLNDDQ